MDAHGILQANRPGRLHPFAVHLDLAARDRLRGQYARLEKPRRPKPFVDTQRTAFSRCHRHSRFFSTLLAIRIIYLVPTVTGVKYFGRLTPSWRATGTGAARVA